MASTLKGNYLSFTRHFPPSEGILSEKVKQLSFSKIQSKRWAGTVLSGCSERRSGLTDSRRHPWG